MKLFLARFLWLWSTSAQKHWFHQPLKLFLYVYPESKVSAIPVKQRAAGWDWSVAWILALFLCQEITWKNVKTKVWTWIMEFRSTAQSITPPPPCLMSGRKCWSDVFLFSKYRNVNYWQTDQFVQRRFQKSCRNHF